MDSFFKAAVCDLDKLLDDFELSSEEPEHNQVYLKPTVCPFSTTTSAYSSSEASTVSTNLPDLSSLHYGSPSPCSERSINHNHTTEEREGNAQPLTDVDLLSSVDQRPAKSSAPPCPDRALKPVCDLVNDTSSAILIRANSHDAFSELDMVEKQMEQEEALLVDFHSSLVSEKGQGGDGEPSSQDTVEEQHSVREDLEEQSSNLGSLRLDIILPTATDMASESIKDSLQPKTTELVDYEEVASSSHSMENSLDQYKQESTHPAECLKEAGLRSSRKEELHKHLDEHEECERESLAEPEPVFSDTESVGLSCLPLAVSMCGALVNNNAVENDCEHAVEPCERDVSQSIQADYCLSAVEEFLLEESPCLEVPAELAITVPHHTVEGSLSPVAASLDFASTDHSEPSPVDPPEFGFEYLPESDQAEMLVTDEELDAFLQAHTEAEQVKSVSCCSRSGDFTQPRCFSESHMDLEGELVDRELINCSQANCEVHNGLASPESDRTMFLPVEENLNPGAPSLSDLSCSPTVVNSLLTSNTFLSQHSISPEHGGARPKTLLYQTSRSPPAEGEEEEEQSLKPACSTQLYLEEVTAGSPTSPSPTEGLSDLRDYSPVYSSQDHEHNSVAYEELSEPPPYPGESSRVGARSADWKREGDEELGSRQPAWVPDAEAPNCMNCSQRFTFTRRRHHCRACGKVYCGVCCNRKCKLKYLEKEARVCVTCFDSIRKAQAHERMMSPTGPSPNPNIPSEYCSTIPPLQQARAAGTLNSPPPTVMVPVSVLKHSTNDSCPREQKRVWFADGILPNGEFADTTKLSVTSRRSGEFTPDQTPSPSGSDTGIGGPSAPEPPGVAEVVRPPLSGPWDFALLSAVGSSLKRISSLLPDNVDALPPLLITTGEEEAGDVLVEENPAPCQILHLLEEGGPRPLTFVLNANLLVNVKIVAYGSRQCWCFGSIGLQALGQKELVFLLECLPEEKTLPQDLFTLYLNIYQDAQKGKFLDDLDNITFTSSFLSSKDHAGMLFFSPSCQPLDGLSLPPQPFLFGLLIQKLEVPWAKVFPLRLLLRLGVEHGEYPTTLTSVRFRNSVYRETGHTIMNLLSDLRNYQYSLSVVEGLRIHMEMGHSYIDIPKSSFNEMLKVVNSSNEHVISVGATFSPEADSHLVCFQNEEGNYQTQANSMPGKTRTVTGASFVVFNGALKVSSGFIAKSSIVEDGLMVQIPPETMESLRTALREQRDFDIPCGKNDGAEVRETVTVRWINWSAPVSKGKTSAVDGRPLDEVRSIRVHNDTEFESDGCSIRCTEVCYQLKTPESSLASMLSSYGAFQKDIALATCSALTPHLTVLMSCGINSLSLRVSTQADMVEYQAGSGGKLLPQHYLNELDSALIPVIHGGSASVPQTAMDMEFLFYITHTI